MLDLAGIVKSVSVFEYMPELKADKILVDKAEAKANINIHRNVVTHQIMSKDGKVSGLEYINRANNETQHSIGVVKHKVVREQLSDIEIESKPHIRHP